MTLLTLVEQGLISQVLRPHLEASLPLALKLPSSFECSQNELAMARHHAQKFQAS